MKFGFSKDYLDLKGNPLAKGNYVIVGVFANEENATNFKARSNSQIVILHKTTKLHYVYTFYSKLTAPVRPKLKEARAKITEEAWILGAGFEDQMAAFSMKHYPKTVFKDGKQRTYKQVFKRPITVLN